MTEALTAATRANADQHIDRATLARLDEAATSTEHWKILVTSGMGFFTDAYDLFIIGVAINLIGNQWGIAGWQRSLVSSLALLTSAAGALFFGRIADRLGRTKIYGYEVLVLAAGAVASAFAPNIWWLIGFRAVLGFGIGGDYPVSATIMSEYAAKRNRGRMVSLVFAMQGAGLVVGPLIAIILLSTGMSDGLAWRIMLALGAVPALSVFWLRRQISETPRFRLARIEAAEVERRAREAGRPTGMRGLLADRRMLRWLVGAGGAWFLFDFAYYGNTIASDSIIKLVAPHASRITQTSYTLAIFAVAAVPAYLLAAWTIDRIGRRLVQLLGFAMMALAFFLLWATPGATSQVGIFLVLFGATYWFAEFGPNTTTFVYPAEIFPVRVRTTSHGVAAAAGKVGAFVGTYVLTAVLPVAGLARASLLPAGVCLLGLLATLLLPEPKGRSLEELTEQAAPSPSSAVALGVAESRGSRAHPA